MYSSRSNVHALGRTSVVVKAVAISSAAATRRCVSYGLPSFSKSDCCRRQLQLGPLIWLLLPGLSLETPRSRTSACTFEHRRESQSPTGVSYSMATLCCAGAAVSAPCAKQQQPGRVRWFCGIYEFVLGHDTRASGAHRHFHLRSHHAGRLLRHSPAAAATAGRGTASAAFAGGRR